MKKIFGYIASALLILFVAVSVGGGMYMTSYALRPFEYRERVLDMHRLWDKSMPGLADWYDSLQVAGCVRDTFITGCKNERLHAVYFAAARPEQACGTALLAHGYTDSHMGMLHLGRMYRDSLNYNVMAVDHHYHGLSEGVAVQMGWLDRINLEKWAQVAHGIWPGQDMVMHGISMGGATVMMASGDPSADYVKAYIDDCGYTSVWDEFKKELKVQFGLPAFPILHGANLVCRLRYGWGFKEASSVKQLEKSTKPVLFIHGGNDSYVPTAHVYVNFDAKKQGYKQLWIAPEATHGNSYQKYPAEYTATVREFLEHISR